VEEAGGRPRANPIVGVLGLVLHLATGVFPYAASGLVAPIEGYVVLYALWLGLLVVAVRLFRARNPFVLLVAPASVAVWLAVISFGGAVLGWTA
jgi:hypothetical protein